MKLKKFIPFVLAANAYVNPELVEPTCCAGLFYLGYLNYIRSNSDSKKSSQSKLNADKASGVKNTPVNSAKVTPNKEISSGSKAQLGENNTVALKNFTHKIPGSTYKPSKLFSNLSYEYNKRLGEELMLIENDFKYTNKAAAMQRTKLLYAVDEIDTSVIEVVRKPLEKDATDAKVCFIIKFTPNEWIFQNLRKAKTDLFHANDIIRLQYLIMATRNKFLGCLPQYITLENVLDPELLKLFNNNSKGLLEAFSHTAIGKSLGYILKDFNLTINKINCLEEQSYKEFKGVSNNIKIATKLINENS